MIHSLSVSWSGSSRDLKKHKLPSISRAYNRPVVGAPPHIKDGIVVRAKVRRRCGCSQRDGEGRANAREIFSVMVWMEKLSLTRSDRGQGGRKEMTATPSSHRGPCELRCGKVKSVAIEGDKDGMDSRPSCSSRFSASRIATVPSSSDTATSFFPVPRLEAGCGARGRTAKKTGQRWLSVASRRMARSLQAPSPTHHC